MPRKSELKQPYLKGFVFWSPIISEWIASDKYTDKAKEDFKASLELMLTSKDLMKVDSK